jgi:hypothetical protein
MIKWDLIDVHYPLKDECHSHFCFYFLAITNLENEYFANVERLFPLLISKTQT